MNTATHSLKDTRTSRIGIGVMLLGAVLSIAGLVIDHVVAQHGNQSCPSGSVLIAKFNYRPHSYQFESPAGNEHVVTLTDASAVGWHRGTRRSRCRASS